MEYPSVGNWLSNLAESTQRVQINYFKHFMQFVQERGGDFKNSTPDDLIDFQRENKDYIILDKLIKPYVRSKNGTYNTKNVRYTNIRSFFKHNRAEIPQDSNLNFHPEREPVRGTLTAEEVKKVILSCNTLYGAIYMCMFQSAMDQEMFTYWNKTGWDSLHEQLRNNPEVIKINLPGRKKMKNIVPFYTFIGHDAIAKIKDWLIIRAQRVKEGIIPENSKFIFTSMYNTPLTKRALRSYWLSHLRKLGIVEPINPENQNDKNAQTRYRTGKGQHEMRDVWRSLWSLSPAKQVIAEFFMGHQIDKLEYDKSFRDVEFYKSEYLKALPYLQLLSRDEPYGRVAKTELDSLRRELEEAKRGQGDMVQHLEAELRAFRENQQEFIRQEIEKVLLLARNK